MADFRTIAACRLCGGAELGEIVDFGNVALGNNLLEDAAAARAAASYPLTLNRCAACGHFQLGCAVAPHLLYATNYTYLSGIGPSFVKHLDDYAAWAYGKDLVPPDGLVVDIGSNDGTALKAFQRRGARVCGVDPASLPAKIANENGVDTLNVFFDADAVAQIAAKYGAADYVTSHNVLAHVDDLGAVFADIHALLKDGGVFCFEIGYFREVLRLGYFDTIYHEHLDYHHAAPLARHLTKLGFDIEEFSVNAAQGGTLRTLCRKTGAGRVSAAARAFLDAERQSEVNDTAFLRDWQGSILRKMAGFAALLRERAAKGLAIAGYGAPTKATLLMKMAGIGAADVRYVVDDNALKVGRFLPVTGIPIRPTAQLFAEPLDAVVVFAWNFADDISAKLGGRFGRPVEMIVPLPEPRTIAL
ncbi:MAG: class I SAM-dependent methyltransferase [Rhizomicrobium sp.]